MYTLLLIALCLSLAACEHVLERSLSQLTFRRSHVTEARRLPVRPQLQCTGGAAQHEAADVRSITCTNHDQYSYAPHWWCRADAPSRYRIQDYTVQCEGYANALDERVLNNSCAIQYKLEYTTRGEVWRNCALYDEGERVEYDTNADGVWRSYVALAASSGVVPGTDARVWQYEHTNGPMGVEGPAGVQGAVGVSGPLGVPGPSHEQLSNNLTEMISKITALQQQNLSVIACCALNQAEIADLQQNASMLAVTRMTQWIDALQQNVSDSHTYKRVTNESMRRAFGFDEPEPAQHANILYSTMIILTSVISVAMLCFMYITMSFAPLLCQDEAPPPERPRKTKKSKRKEAPLCTHGPPIKTEVLYRMDTRFMPVQDAR